MLVQRILDFIKTLEKECKLISCDEKLLECLSERFSKRKPSDELTREDFLFLRTCYKSRWERTFEDNDHTDYTLDPYEINKHWINLALDLAPFLKINYLKILIPTIRNETDLNDGSSLNETVNLFNFYLGHGGKTLYRKLSFCRHLESQNFELSTRREDGKLSIVTIDELARLKLCKQTDRKVSIGSEEFKNFWDLMRKKVFPNLRAKGRMPIALLPHLLELSEHYYDLKSKKIEFSVFKNDVNNFFRRLFRYQLADVNYLYGTIIESREEGDLYLLDLFIALKTAKDYKELDIVIKKLSKWLFQFNSDLKAKNEELEHVYLDLDGKQNRATQITDPTAYVNCCKLLISLLTTHFELSLFYTRETYSLWDIKNNVFPEAFAICSILLPAIAANKPKDLENAYAEIIHDIIIPARMDNTWYTWFNRHSSISKWLELVHNCKWDELGVHWFEPELLFNALLLFNTQNQSLKTKINFFLDDIIQTYAQNQNDLMKQFRVNILFTEFWAELNDNHRNYLFRLIALCNQDTAKSNFLYNCSKHINECVAQLGTENTSPHFFSHPIKKEKAHLFTLPQAAENVEAMIISYKNQLSDLKIEPKRAEKISDYLFTLGQPILTVAQREKAKNSGRATLDYIGQYT